MAEKSFGVKEINLIGASGTPTIESPNNLNLNANNVAISTNVSIGGTLSVTGNVSVGGTLTYEDVTNIDSVGLITARSGIHINNEAISGIGITINMSGINVSSGIITAPSFRAPYNGGFSMTQGQYNNGYYINSTGGNTLIGMAYYSNNTIGLGGNGSSLIPFKIDDVSQITLSPNTGNVALAYAGNTKLSTTSTGVNVTGAITVNGSALSITPTTSDIQIVYEITSSSSNSYYRFAGNGVDSSANNPDLYLERGKKYRFINNSGGNHPFRIQSDNSSTLYSTGVTNNNASTGNIDFAIRWDAPAQLYYKCGNHGAMLGNIYINGGQYGGMTLLASATLSSSGTVAANITFNTAGFQYLYGKLHSVTRPSGGIGDIGLRWNGTSSAVYDFVMQRLDNNGSGSARYTQGANQFYYNMNGVAGWTSGRNQGVFELHLVNDGVRKPFNMKHSGELNGGPIVLTTDGMLDLTSSITSLEITTSDTDINGGTLELYGVR